ncbi:sensor histidine kinase [Dyella choica]|nr:sensor histidine kinase [Dyella choica]
MSCLARTIALVALVVVGMVQSAITLAQSSAPPASGDQTRPAPLSTGPVSYLASPPELAFRYGFYEVQPPAQKPDASSLNIDVKQFHQTMWTERDGAPKSVVVSMAQTRDGFLWLGTESGLIRFDGANFDDRYTRELSSPVVYALFADPNGDLWIGLTFGGISRLHDGHIENFDIHELDQSAVFAIARGPDGRLYAGATHALLVFAGGRWIKAGVAEGYDGTPPWWMGQRKGALWVITEHAAFVMRAGSSHFEPAQREEALLLPFDLPFGERLPRGPDYPFTPTLTDAAGALWFEKLGRGLGRFRWIDTPSGRTPVEEFFPVYTDTSFGVNHFLADQEGNVWAATTLGIMKLSRTKFAPLSTGEYSYWPVLEPNHGGGVWIGGLNHGLVSADTGTTKIDSPTPSIYCLRDDGRGTLWMVGKDAVYGLSGGHTTTLPLPPGADHKGDRCQSLTGDATSGLWLSMAQVGLFEYKNGNWIINGGQRDLPMEPATRILKDEQGRLWFVYVRSRLALLENNVIKLFTANDGLSVGNPLALFVRGSTLWVSGDKAVVFFQEGRFHALHGVGGEDFAATSGILETKEGELWLNSQHGVYRIDAREIALVRADPQYQVRFERFDESDGITNGLAALIRPGPTLAQSQDGRIWVSTLAGVSWIDPKHILRNRLVPPVHVQALQAGEVDYAVDSRPVLPKLTRNLRIDYTVASMTRPDRVHFRYQLEGVDKGWQDAGTRRSAYYTNLEPGHYTFQVIAINEDGVSSTLPGRLSFSIAPAFYQTIAFKLVCAMLALVMAWLAVLAYVRMSNERLRARMQERHNERERIARDLHDTLLQGIHGLVLNIHVANQRLPEEEPVRTQLDDALDRAEVILDEGRNRVSGLRTRSRQGLDRGLAELGETLSTDHAVAFRLVRVGEARDLEPVVDDEVRLIVREALLNAFQHAHADEVEVEIDYGFRQFSVRIRDDGVGIDANVLEKGLRPGHWGLPSMRERAANIKANLTISARPQHGTEIEVKVPAAVAYADELTVRRSWLSRLLGAGR